MYFSLIIAIISTLLWINALFAEYVQSTIKHFSDAEDQKLEEERAKFRTILVIIMGMFWASVIYFW